MTIMNFVPSTKRSRMLYAKDITIVAICGHEIARFKQNGFYHCVDCLLQENGVESFEVKHYTWDRDYLGNENDIDEVIDIVIENCEDINVIEEY